MWRIGLLILLVAHPALAADPPKVVEVPRGDPAAWAEVKAVPGRLLTLSAEPASKWLLVDEDAADLKVFDAGKFAAFVAPAAGRHKLIVTSPDGTAARVVLVVGDAPPGPGPKPPEPPADALKDRVAKAFAGDAEPDAAKKRASAKVLAELYRQIASDVCPDAEVTSPTRFLETCQKLGAKLVGPGALLGVRKVVAEELAAVMPVEADLTQPQRDAAAKLFRKLSRILDGLGG